MKLVAENLSFAYDEASCLWENVNFTLQKGEILSIMGGNGCGKSTLIRCLIGFIKPKTGNVYLETEHGEKYDIFHNPQEFTRLIGYVPQIQNTAYSFMVRDYIVMGRAPHLGVFEKPTAEDYEKADAIMQELNIYDIRFRSFNTLSGGQQRQAIIARAIIQEPEIIIMDEPTNHLDYGNQYRVIEMVQKLSQRGISVLLTTHMPDHAMYLQGTVGMILDKRFQCGPADNIITEENLQKLYKLRVRLVELPELGRKICLAENS